MQRALVELAATGDEDAFGTLIAQAGGRLMAIAFRILRDVGRAEDAVQNAFVSAWRDLPMLRDPKLFDAWLTKLLLRACYAEAARSRRWTENVQELPIDGPATADSTATVGDRDELNRAFLRLTAEQRAIFVLHQYGGWSQPELASNLDLPLGTVKSRLHYATKALRAAVEADSRTADSVGSVA